MKRSQVILLDEKDVENVIQYLATQFQRDLRDRKAYGICLAQEHNWWISDPVAWLPIVERARPDAAALWSRRPRIVSRTEAEGLLRAAGDQRWKEVRDELLASHGLVESRREGHMYELIDWTAWDDAGLPPSRRFARDTSEGRRFDWPNILLSMAFSLLVVEPVAYLVGGALDRAAHEATPTELVAEQADLSGGKPFPKLLYVAPGWPPLQVVPSEATDREQTQPLGYLLVVGGEYSLCKDGLLVEEPKCLYDLGLTRRSDEAQGPFVLRWCPSCGAYVLYLADACPFCSGQL